jgi:uncharacterized OsmC-like protein
MSNRIRVEHRGGDAFDVSIGHHVLRVDQPVDDGGEDSGPTPTELFVAGLASCVAHYARRFLHRHALSTEGLTVTATFAMAEDRPARVADISVEIGLPADVPEDRVGALLAVARHCTVHNSLDRPPRVRVNVEGSDVPESGAA